MAWIFLTVAGVLEIIWVYCMKQSDGFSKPLPGAITVGTMVASIALLSVSMKTLPMGTAYMVWGGIGALGSFVLGIAVLGEAASPMRLCAAALLVGGIVLMKLASPH